MLRIIYVQYPIFRKKGVMFRDVTTVLQDARGLELAVDSLAGLLDGVEFDVLVGIESRGFLFGTPIAYKLKKAVCARAQKGQAAV